MPVRRIRTALLAVVALLAATLVGVAPTASAQPQRSHHHHSATWTVWAGSQSRDKAIQGMRFLPGSVVIHRGDSVQWLANSAEPHTVTFFRGGGTRSSLPEFDPSKAIETHRIGGSVYTPARYFNSGILTTSSSAPVPGVPVHRSYRLTFPRTGSFTYYCWVHGVMMVGHITVRPSGARLPHTQAEYTAMARAEARALLAEGRRLWRQTLAMSGPRLVMAGNDNAVMLARFVRQVVRIRVGQTVTWKNPGMLAPHTVTFGKPPTAGGGLAPTGHPRHFAGGSLSSGIIPPHGSYHVRFVKPGTYHYVCLLHDELGMVGTVVVRR